MVRVTLTVEASDRDSAEGLAEVVREGCDDKRWKLVAFEYSDSCNCPECGKPMCPECGKPMEWDATLQAYACHQEE